MSMFIQGVFTMDCRLHAGVDVAQPGVDVGLSGVCSTRACSLYVDREIYLV